MLFRIIVLNQHKNLLQNLIINNKNSISLNVIKSFSTFKLKSNNLISLIKPENTRELFKLIKRDFNSRKSVSKIVLQSRNKNVVLYSTAFVLIVLGMTYASVPLYRIYCQSTGKGGKPFIDEKAIQKVVHMVKNEERVITVTFSAETTSQMAWNFKPTQHEIRCSPGETVLAFFTAKNPLDVPVNGIATYSVQPYEAGLYLNKIQCFCFEEQRLNPNEEVDLPVFFYIDPDYAEDPKLENVDNIVLSYTFFQAKEGFKLPTFPYKLQNTLSLEKL